MSDQEQPSELARAARLVRWGPDVWHQCATCGKSFNGAARSLYCSSTCKVRAFRARRKQQGQPNAAPRP